MKGYEMKLGQTILIAGGLDRKYIIVRIKSSTYMVQDIISGDIFECAKSRAVKI